MVRSTGQKYFFKHIFGKIENYHLETNNVILPTYSNVNILSNILHVSTRLCV